MNTDQLRYRVLAIPLNGHGPDDFDGPSNGCPVDRAVGSDFNIRDLDSFCALADFVAKLRVERVISSQVQKSLMKKLTDAETSVDRSNICAAVNVLNEFVNQVSTQLEK